MANIEPIKIPIEFFISEETIECCCKLLSLYFTDHPELDCTIVDSSERREFSITAREVGEWL